MDECTEPLGTSYMQNRELSWLDFNKRVLDQGADKTVPLLERLNFISIFWSNLQEFFMVRVGSLTDLSLLKTEIIDTKTGMTPKEQLDAIYKRCFDLYTDQEAVYDQVRSELAEQGVVRLHPSDLNKEQFAFLSDYVRRNILPLLSPQIINSRHPFPHLENGALYVALRLDDETTSKKSGKSKGHGAAGVTLGFVPMPRQCARIIQVPGDGFQFVLLEHAIEMFVDEVFSMYTVKHTNIICVTRNADLDASEGLDESDYDYREHMKRILKKRTRLAPVRLESERKLSDTVRECLLERLELKPSQIYTTYVPLDMSYTYALSAYVPAQMRKRMTSTPFSPAWPASLSQKKSIMKQVLKRDVLLSYPYESMDPFVRLLQEAAFDPRVTSIKITLYRLARQSQLAEALITAAERGKEVTALFELRARFDENNNIEWSQRFEQAGCNVIYGFRDYKVHSKICCITRQTDEGPQFITQLGTGNYNEKTARLYTDFSFITTDTAIARDATEFFRNMTLESASDNYTELWVAPLQIKQNIMAGIDEQIALTKNGEPCGLFFKTNSVTDIDIIEKIVEASQAGVPTTLFVRGISCIVPGIKGCTDNVRVVSIVGRLLEHSRIYGFGPHDDMSIYLSSADLMTRNMDKRVEIAWPVHDDTLRRQVIDFIDTCLADTAKLRELQPDRSYTPLRFFKEEGADPFDAQQHMIDTAQAAYQASIAKKKGDASKTKKEQPATQADSCSEVACEPVEPELTEPVASEPVTSGFVASESVAPTRTEPVADAVMQPAQPASPDVIELPIEAKAQTELATIPSEQCPPEQKEKPDLIVHLLAKAIVRLGLYKRR